MRVSSFLRISLLSAAFSAALSAHAVTLGLSSSGLATFGGSPATFGANESIIVQQGGYGTLTAVQYAVSLASFPPGGTGSFTGPGGKLNFSLVFATGLQVGTSQTASGTWTATGGTGTYQNATGSGTFASSITLGASQSFDSFTIFRGDVQAVPEPATFAALGLGAVAMLRRRKRA